MKIRKIARDFLNIFGITPYVYYTYKHNNPLAIKKKLFKDKNCIIFDVGAYDGRSIDMYKKAFPKSTVFSFEPTPNMFSYLNEKYKNREDVKLFNAALSSEVGETTFFINNSQLTNSLLKSADNQYIKSQSCYDNKAEILVKTDTIDQILNKEKISKINILKIDAQGADIYVLKGAEVALKNKMIDLIFVEVEFLQLYEDQLLFHDISAYLNSFGYYLYSLYNIGVSKKGQMIYGDAIFLNSEIKI